MPPRRFLSWNPIFCWALQRSEWVLVNDSLGQRVAWVTVLKMQGVHCCNGWRRVEGFAGVLCKCLLASRRPIQPLATHATHARHAPHAPHAQGHSPAGPHSADHGGVHPGSRAGRGLLDVFRRSILF